jgi:hypothetical protein
VGFQILNPRRYFAEEVEETLIGKLFFAWLPWIPLGMMRGTLYPHRCLLPRGKLVSTYPTVDAHKGKLPSRWWINLKGFMQVKGMSDLLIAFLDDVDMALLDDHTIASFSRQRPDMSDGEF